MKVLIDGRLIADKPTGISRYSIELIKAYNTRYGKENVVVLANFDYSPQISNKIIYTFLKPYNLFHFLLFPFIFNWSHFDLYHIPFYSGPFWHPKKIKVISTVHDLMFYKVQGFFTNKIWLNYLARIYYWIIVKLTLNSSNGIVSVSEATRRDIKDIFVSDAIVFHGGVNEIDQSVNGNFDLVKYGVEKGKYFLYVGNGRPHKNLKFLINTFLKYRGVNKLLIIGNTKNYLKHSEDRVIQIEHVMDYELSELYKNCKTFIFPSKYEGFGLPILEALSNHCYIFCSNAGALSEFKFKSISFFDPNNQEELLRLLNDADNYKFNISDLDLLTHYQWENSLKHMLDWIEQDIVICTS